MSHNEHTETERKFLVSKLPEDLSSYPNRTMEQAYLNREPVVRIRKSPDHCTLTYKGSGLLTHSEYNLPLTFEAYEHLREKADGKIIEKTRYNIPYGQYTIELDIFEGDLKGLILAEVEFPDVEEAMRFVKPDWFTDDVTEDPRYHNVYMAYES